MLLFSLYFHLHQNEFPLYVGRPNFLHLYILDIIINIWIGVCLSIGEGVLGKRKESRYVQIKCILCMQQSMRHDGSRILSDHFYDHTILHGGLQKNSALLFLDIVCSSIDCHHQPGIYCCKPQATFSDFQIMRLCAIKTLVQAFHACRPVFPLSFNHLHYGKREDSYCRNLLSWEMHERRLQVLLVIF